jgi:hypothetical protein
LQKIVTKCLFREFMLAFFMLRLAEAMYEKLLSATDRKDRAVWQVMTERQSVRLGLCGKL